MAKAKRPVEPKPKVVKVEKPSPFTAIKAISAQRPLKYADLVAMNAPYEPFMVNRSFSLTADTVLAASMMNQRGHLGKEEQATFMIHTVRPSKRWNPWPKTRKEENIKVIALYYGYSIREARHAESLHTTEQITAMSKVLADGARPSRVK